MTRSEHTRYQLFLPRELAERFEALAGRPGVTKSSILVEALAAWLDRRGSSELEDRFAARLDRMSHQLARIERDGRVELESTALFVRYVLAAMVPPAPGDDAARAKGRERFDTFVIRVGEALRAGRRSLDPEQRP